MPNSRFFRLHFRCR